MDSQTEKTVYVSMMLDSLRRKKSILTNLLDLTKKQEHMLKGQELDVDGFQRSVDRKGDYIEQLNQMDEGFDRLFKQVKEEIVNHRQSYKEEILLMQKLIQQVSELGVEIQALENQNSIRFKAYLSDQRKDIRDFHVNSRTTNTYMQNMTGGNMTGQSYYFNETK
ncbi:MAG: flagellar protein FlgN [Eubacterium sp.]|nr:flagellar protein FlgN [Eubacterium sp.]